MRNFVKKTIPHLIISVQYTVPIKTISNLLYAFPVVRDERKSNHACPIFFLHRKIKYISLARKNPKLFRFPAVKKRVGGNCIPYTRCPLARAPLTRYFMQKLRARARATRSAPLCNAILNSPNMCVTRARLYV